MKSSALLGAYPIITNQVSQQELSIILSHLERILEDGASGAIVEFGCYSGTTSLFIRRLLDACHAPNQFHVYDSFEGLPEKSLYDQSPAGLQFMAGELSASKKEFIMNFKKAGLHVPVIHKGWFKDVTPDDVPEPISFAFLDGDYYESIRDPLKLIWPRLTEDAVVVVDDYANEALPGAQKAVNDWLSLHPAKLRVEASLGIISVAS